jgi:hypothetical protein
MQPSRPLAGRSAWIGHTDMDDSTIATLEKTRAHARRLHQHRLAVVALCRPEQDGCCSAPWHHQPCPDVGKRPLVKGYPRFAVDKRSWCEIEAELVRFSQNATDLQSGPCRCSSHRTTSCALQPRTSYERTAPQGPVVWRSGRTTTVVASLLQRWSVANCARASSVKAP